MRFTILQFALPLIDPWNFLIHIKYFKELLDCKTPINNIKQI